jgi:hypothetical protein
MEDGVGDLQNFFIQKKNFARWMEGGWRGEFEFIDYMIHPLSGGYSYVFVFPESLWRGSGRETCWKMRFC